MQDRSCANGMNADRGSSSSSKTIAVTSSSVSKDVNPRDFGKDMYQDNQTKVGSSTDPHIYSPEDNNIDTPKIGETFPTLDEALDRYRHYAIRSGFMTRLGSETQYEDKTLRKKHIRCNRYGQPKDRKGESYLEALSCGTNKKTAYSCTGCMAMMGIHRDQKSDTFIIYKIDIMHNHPLSREYTKPVTTISNTLSYLERQFILKASTLNIGATKAHKLYVSLKGGYDRFGASKEDFKNFWRDYVNIVGPNDAQCVIEQLTIRKNAYPNFYFKCNIKDSVLKGLFWADELDKEHFQQYSDVISLDATYRTNRYKMIFVPITAINNHDKTINVGSALLSDETIESYTWLLETFLEAHGHAPKLLLSDQDAALNQAIATAFPNTHHRLCMWHIMTKLPNKVASEVVENFEFKKRLHKIVWNLHIPPDQFEEQWKLMLDEFKLHENKWLHDMYEIRHKWIPAYFKHIPCCGLMKTTSRSESTNSFFNVFSNHNNLLVNFMFNFDTAISKQRYEQRRLDIKSNTTTPILFSAENPLEIEIHASKVYTREMFFKVQKEIKKAFTLCFQTCFSEDGQCEVHIIVFRNHKTKSKMEFRVTINKNEDSYDCSYDKFGQYGILCCHVFRVFLNNDIYKIPDRYLLKRWLKNEETSKQKDFINRWGICNNETSRLVEEATYYAEKCIEQVVNNKEKLCELVDDLKSLSIQHNEDTSSTKKSNGKQEMVEEMLGINIRDNIDVIAPCGIANKGGSRRTRMISNAEKGKKQYMKPARECKGCHLYVNHDRRNCPVNPSKKLHPHKKNKQ